MFPFKPLEVYTLFDSTLPITTGIYAIVNVTNGKYYIGSTKANGRYTCEKGFRGRFRPHRSQLLNGNHHCKHLQNSYNKTIKEGLCPNSVYSIWILEYTPSDLCLAVEQVYLDRYKPKYNGTLTAGGGFMSGLSHTLETRLKMSKARIGMEFSEKTKALMAEAQKGNKCARRETYVAVSQTGDIIYFINAKAFCESEFGKANKFSRPKISDCAKGKRPLHRNHQFFYVDDFLAD